MGLRAARVRGGAIVLELALQKLARLIQPAQAQEHARVGLGLPAEALGKLVQAQGLVGAALLFTWGLLKFSVRLAADALPVEYGTLVFDVTPDLAIFVYVLAISLLAGVLFGLAPAIESSRSALSPATRASTPSVRSRSPLSTSSM